MARNRICAAWRPYAFFILHGVAIALLASWLWPVTRLWWDGIDAFIFRTLNQTLALGRGWAGIWAVGSSRYFDIVVALVVVAFILRKNLVFKKVEVRRALFTILGLMAIMLVFRTGFTLLVDGMGWQHSSPTKVTPDAIRLSQEFPTFKKLARVKDSSPRSFPGDHASVLLLWGLFLAIFARGRRIILPLCLTVLFIMPRLIAGAHWFTDVVVGGALLALLAIAWGYCTPVTGWISTAAEVTSRPVIHQLRKVRFFRRLSFFYHD